jgi:hypothetical protein
MQRENLEIEWNNISEKLLNRFPKLTSADLIFHKGSEEEMIERIGLKLKKTRVEVLTLIATL